IRREQLLGHGDVLLQLFVDRQAADELCDGRHVRDRGGPDGHCHWGRSRNRKTRRIAPSVSEKLAILLSTRPAASPAAMTSVSLIAARPPLGRTTQIAPFGSIHFLTSFNRRRSAASRAPMNTRSTGVRGRPRTMS